MQIATWARSLAACALLSCTLSAGDYDHVLDVVKQTWPERAKGMAICSLESNQFTLLDLVDTAKARGLSLVIINIKDVRELDATLKSSLTRRPDFLLIIDDDPILGTKSVSTGRLVGRASSMNIPSVGLDAKLLHLGGAMVTGSAADAKVLVNTAILTKLKLATPEGASDPAVVKP